MSAACSRNGRKKSETTMSRSARICSAKRRKSVSSRYAKKKESGAKRTNSKDGAIFFYLSLLEEPRTYTDPCTDPFVIGPTNGASRV